jgi:ribonuclease BN (tRNA processing enzyme)
MSAFRLICLGCGDAFSARWYSSCLAVQAEGRTLLIDCPHPIRKILSESSASAGTPLDARDIDALALTHLHADHASGVEGLGYYAHYHLARTVPLLTHPDVGGALWERQLEVTMGRVNGLTPDDPSGRAVGLDHYFDLISLSTTRPTRFGPFDVECRQTLHPVPTYALRISAGDRTLGYSADTSFDLELISWLGSADLIVHETNYGIHTAYESLAALPAPLRAKMRLIHYPDDFDLEKSAIEPLRQGRSYLL